MMYFRQQSPQPKSLQSVTPPGDQMLSLGWVPILIQVTIQTKGCFVLYNLSMESQNLLNGHKALLEVGIKFEIHNSEVNKT